MTSILAIIPARSGSKSLVDKNIRILSGVPLLAHSVQYALSSPLINKAIVSTDSDIYRSVGISYGATSHPLRPAHLSLDDSLDIGFLSHEVNYLSSKGENYDFIALLRPTSPLRPPKLIEKAVQILLSEPNVTCVRTVTPSRENPFKSWTINDDGCLSPFFGSHDDEFFNQPRQLLADTFWQTGHLDLISVHCIKNLASSTGPFIKPLFVSDKYSVDIDTLQDFNLAESFLSSDPSN